MSIAWVHLIYRAYQDANGIKNARQFCCHSPCLELSHLDNEIIHVRTISRIFLREIRVLVVALENKQNFLPRRSIATRIHWRDEGVVMRLTRGGCSRKTNSPDVAPRVALDCLQVMSSTPPSSSVILPSGGDCMLRSPKRVANKVTMPRTCIRSQWICFVAC